MISTFNTSTTVGRDGLRALDQDARYRILEIHTAAAEHGHYVTVRYEDAPSSAPFTCDGCHLPIQDVGYASMGGNFVPYIPAKNYHLGCVPRVPAAPRELNRFTLDALTRLAETAISTGIGWGSAAADYEEDPVNEPHPGLRPEAADLVTEWLNREEA